MKPNKFSANNSQKIIAVGGSAANPPHLGHKALLEALIKSNRFNKIMWIPSGLRSDKKGFIQPEHRVKMTQLTLASISDKRLIINLSDVYGKNMPTIEWLEILHQQNPDAKIIWYTGIDSVIPLEKYQGKCEIEAVWCRGQELMENYEFLIIPRIGYPHPREIKIPLKHFEILDVKLPNISSTEIRRRIRTRANGIEQLVTDEVAQYIKKNNLYCKKGDK